MKSLGLKLKEFGKANGVAKTREYLSEAIAKGDIQPNRLSIRGLAEGIIGEQWAETMHRFNGPERMFMESTEAVDASNFAAITGQILITTVKEKFKLANFIGDSLVNTIPAGQNLSQELIPWLSDTTSDSETVEQGMPYPETRFVGNYIKLPAIEKVKPGPGFYLVAGLHSSEAKANKQIKDLYKKGVLSYKIYDPSNKSYYVYLKDFASEKDANRGIFYYEASVPQVWIREVK